MDKDRFMQLEIVGDIDRRVTATRLILTGPLAFGLRKKKDSRELWFTVEGEGLSYVQTFPNFASAAARKFAAHVNAQATAMRAVLDAPALSGGLADRGKPASDAPVVASATGELVAHLEQLREMRDAGDITPDEFTRLKARVISGEEVGGSVPAPRSIVEASDVPTTWDVVLVATGRRKIQVTKKVRAAAGLGLREAKMLVDSAAGAPAVVRGDLNRADAEVLKVALETAGAIVELKSH